MLFLTLPYAVIHIVCTELVFFKKLKEEENWAHIVEKWEEIPILVCC